MYNPENIYKNYINKTRPVLRFELIPIFKEQPKRYTFMYSVLELISDTSQKFLLKDNQGMYEFIVLYNILYDEGYSSATFHWIDMKINNVSYAEVTLDFLQKLNEYRVVDITSKDPENYTCREEHYIHLNWENLDRSVEYYLSIEDLNM